MRGFAKKVIGFAVCLALIGCASGDAFVKEVRTEKQVDLSSLKCLYFEEWQLAYDNNYSADELSGFEWASKAAFNKGLSRSGYFAHNESCVGSEGRALRIELFQDYRYNVYANVFDARSDQALFSSMAGFNQWTFDAPSGEEIYETLGSRVGIWLDDNGFG